MNDEQQKEYQERVSPDGEHIKYLMENPEINCAEEVCKCGHPFSEHFDASVGCWIDLALGLADNITNYCRHCEENAAWQEDPRQGIEEKEL